MESIAKITRFFSPLVSPRKAALEVTRPAQEPSSYPSAAADTTIDVVSRHQEDALSTSSLTSLASNYGSPIHKQLNDGPKSSQVQPVGSSFTSSASRRVVVNNIKAVTDSDSEGLSDSSDGLLDLDDLIARKRRKLSPREGSIAKPVVIADDAPGKRPARPKYRHSLSSIVAQHKADELSESRLRETEASLEAQEAKDNHRSVVADAALSDEDDNERVKAALRRIAADDNKHGFHFFRKTISAQSLDFPTAAIPDRWRELCKQSQRHQFFTSGLAVDIARKHSLPEELLLWINDRLLHEESTQLCEAYLSILAAVRLPPAIEDGCLLSRRYAGCTMIDPVDGDNHDRSDSLTTANGHDRDISDNMKTADGHEHNVPHSLSSILRVQKICASTLSNAQRIAAIFELVLLNADDSIKLRNEIRGTLEALLDSTDEILPAVIERILSSNLTSHQLYFAIATLPAGPGRLHRFRRLLALHCILSSDASDLIDVSSADNTTRLLVKLKKDPKFDVRAVQNWPTFQALVNVLDIAIDDGFSDFSFLHDHAEQLMFREQKTSPAETDFNNQMDDICKRLHLMLNNIKDGGTAGLSRTAAKYTLESLCVRLETTARTKARIAAGLFSNQMQDKQRGFLESFLNQTGVESE